VCNGYTGHAAYTRMQTLPRKQGQLSARVAHNLHQRLATCVYDAGKDGASHHPPPYGSQQRGRGESAPQTWFVASKPRLDGVCRGAPELTKGDDGLSRMRCAQPHKTYAGGMHAWKQHECLSVRGRFSSSYGFWRWGGRKGVGHKGAVPLAGGYGFAQEGGCPAPTSPVVYAPLFACLAGLTS
jgi:hypothetical protein